MAAILVSSGIIELYQTPLASHPFRRQNTRPACTLYVMNKHTLCTDLLAEPCIEPLRPAVAIDDHVRLRSSYTSNHRLWLAGRH